MPDASAMNPSRDSLAVGAEARLALRDRPDTADALLRGTLRDLSYETWETSPRTDTTRYRAELQLCMEKPNGEVLWSDTLAVTEDVVADTGLWGMLCRFFPSLETHPARVVLVPLACLAGLWILGKLIAGMTRVR